MLSIVLCRTVVEVAGRWRGSVGALSISFSASSAVMRLSDVVASNPGRSAASAPKASGYTASCSRAAMARFLAWRACASAVAIPLRILCNQNFCRFCVPATCCTFCSFTGDDEAAVRVGYRGGMRLMRDRQMAHDDVRAQIADDDVICPPLRHDEDEEAPRPKRTRGLAVEIFDALPQRDARIERVELAQRRIDDVACGWCFVAVQELSVGD